MLGMYLYMCTMYRYFVCHVYVNYIYFTIHLFVYPSICPSTCPCFHVYFVCIVCMYTVYVSRYYTVYVCCDCMQCMHAMYIYYVFFFYGNEHLHNKHKNNGHLAPWLLWVPGIQKKVITKCKNYILKIVKL